MPGVSSTPAVVAVILTPDKSTLPPRAAVPLTQQPHAGSCARSWAREHIQPKSQTNRAQPEGSAGSIPARLLRGHGDTGRNPPEHSGGLTRLGITFRDVCSGSPELGQNTG